jgi:hypothetical protein
MLPCSSRRSLTAAATRPSRCPLEGIQESEGGPLHVEVPFALTRGFDHEKSREQHTPETPFWIQRNAHDIQEH